MRLRQSHNHLLQGQSATQALSGHKVAALPTGLKAKPGQAIYVPCR